MREFDLAEFNPPLTVPELRGGAVTLRGFIPEDLALVRAAGEDPYIPSISSIPQRCSEEAARAFIARQQERAASGHGYSFVIAEGDAGAGVGSIGLWLNDIDNGRASVGYWVVAAARGRHLAALALDRLVAFAFDTLAIPRLHLFVEPWNVASSRTAELAGFTREALLRGWERIDGEQHDVFAYSLLQHEWASPPVAAG
jgi:RimJ/RimL family protein N-acetyltransferase